jgi:hypothetical protein
VLLSVLGFIFSLFGGWPPAFEGSAGGLLFLFELTDNRSSAAKETRVDIGRRFS